MNQHARPRQVWLDVLLAVIVFAIIVGTSMVNRPAELPWTAGLGAVLCGLLVFRRRWPIPVLACTGLGSVVYLAFGSPPRPLLLTALVALFTVATLSERRTAWTAGAITAAALAGSSLLSAHWPWLLPDVLGVLAWSGMAIAAGDAVRSRRAYVAEIEERARRAERNRDEEARRRVVEERLRIARELHDVLAHHIALINVQAGVAAHMLDSEPQQSRTALAHIRTASRSALEGLRTTVGLLRQDGESVAPTAPTAGLAQLDELISSFRSAGLVVETAVEGTAAALPDAVDLAAYRVIQESLTNVHKHAGPATATVHLDYTGTELRLSVVDDGRGAPSVDAGQGHGIIGMRERVTALGGRLAAGPRTAGGFQVQACLPLPKDDRS
ncbi:sensor histidine kinase [Saccharopolyspora elongata]|nr:histidine kinase [Saccharopolyspora elongata]